MVYSIQTGGRKGSCIFSNNCAIVLHQGEQYRCAGGGGGGGGGGERMVEFVHNSLEVNAYLVKAKLLFYVYQPSQSKR